MPEFTYSTGASIVGRWRVPTTDQWLPLLASFVERFNPATMPTMEDFTDVDSLPGGDTYDPEGPNDQHLDELRFAEWLQATWDFAYILAEFVDPTKKVAAEQWRSILEPYLVDWDGDVFELVGVQ